MKYIIVTEETIYSSIFSVLFDEVISSGAATIVNEYLDKENKIKDSLLKILYKNTLNNYLKCNFEQYLHPKFALCTRIEEFDNDDICVIFTNASLQKVYSSQNMKRIKARYPGIKFVLLFVDSIFQPQARKAYELSNEKLFDLIYTYNEADAINKGFIYTPTPYSYIGELDNKNFSHGVFFCGSEKGRGILLDKIAGKLKKLDISFDFQVFGKKERLSNIEIQPYVLRDYKEVLKETLDYDTILDVAQESNGLETGLSLRIYESLVYGRRLITNNSSILDFEYYNPQNMHYFETIEDIKKEWFDTDIENKYDSELSPLHFLNDINKRLPDSNA